ncbi:nucleoside deaminase [Comamonas sp. GB3 AK4-5]|uniref:nucleoside deaminase n=1 Tax=Comamonas sp. GB3 AK4-5 TaxID=3231487 RepID=UPI00351DBB04
MDAVFSPADHHAMALAIAASREALAAGDMPFGATLSSADGQVLWVARNAQISTQDCMAHAETVLVQQVQRELGPQALQGATVHASGEPCAMCSGALFWAGVRRVVYAASTEDIAHSLGGPVLPVTAAQVLGSAQPQVSVQGGLQRDAAVQVLQAKGLAADAAS